MAGGLLFGGLSAWAGLVTSATSDAVGPGVLQHVCDTGSTTGSFASCSAFVSGKAASSSWATASYGSASAYVQGGAYLPGYGASATAFSSFTDTLTFFGGTGAGVLSILESVVSFGTGSLQAGNSDWHPTTILVKESFTFGTPFTLSISAFSAGNFYGGLGDAGSLLVSKSLESLTVLDSNGKPVTGLSYTDVSGHVYSASGATFTNTPEPAAWVLGGIGALLLGIAKLKSTKKKEDQAAKGDEQPPPQ